MKKVVVSMMAVAFAVSMSAQTKPAVKTNPKPVTLTKPAAPKNPGIKTTKDSLAYAIGVNIAGSLQQQQLGDINLTLLQKGLQDIMQKKTPYIDPQAGNMCIQTYMQAQQEKSQAKAMESVNAEKAKCAAFLETNKKRTGVITLPDGLQYEVIIKGSDSAATPKAADTVVVNYAGTLVNGTEFDNSYKRGEPLVIPVSGVITGWTEILQLMHVGDKWKVFIPSDLAYGDRGRGGQIPGGTTLIFEMELLGVKPAASR